jgi:hypothetical protein
MYTSPRGKGAAALGALAIFLSLHALQPRQNCTSSRHRTKHDRRCCIPWQYRRAAMTPPHPSISKPRLKAVTLPPPPDDEHTTTEVLMMMIMCILCFSRIFLCMDHQSLAVGVLFAKYRGTCQAKSNAERLVPHLIEFKFDQLQNMF